MKFKYFKILSLGILIIFSIFGVSFSASKDSKISSDKVNPQINATEQTSVTSKEAVSTQEQKTSPTEKFEQITVKGVVKEIANDKSYIVVEDTKILTTKEFLEEMYIEVGDKVEITAEKTSKGLEAKDCIYLFDEETEPGSLEEEPITE